MIKVLEVFGEPIISGGQEAFVNNVVENIDWNDLTIDLFTPYYCDNDLYRCNVEKKGGKVYAVGLEFNPGKSRFNIEKALDIHLKNHHYDVVHVHSGSISVLALTAKIAKRNQINKVFVHSHSPIEHETLKHSLIKMCFSRDLKKYPTAYLACSMNAALCKYPNKIAKTKTIFIKNGINLEKYRFDVLVRNKIRKQLNIEDDEYVIGHVGRFSKEKNHLFLIDVFVRLLENKNKVRLLLVGDGELRNVVTQKVHTLGIDGDVIFTGNVTNVHEYMQAMDCFVLPSFYEGLPFVGVEAQAAGMPVIVSTGVSPELKLTDLIHYEELDIDKWVDAIKKWKILKRSDDISTLRNQGFDILQTVSMLRQMYI